MKRYGRKRPRKQRRRFNRRLCEYRAQKGREFEQVTFRKILTSMVKRRLILAFIISAPDSKDDRLGIDCRVWKVIRGRVYERCCGVTISYDSWQRACERHPDVTQFYMPLKIGAPTIERRVLKLFKGART